MPKIPTGIKNFRPGILILEIAEHEAIIMNIEDANAALEGNSGENIHAHGIINAEKLNIKTYP